SEGQNSGLSGSRSGLSFVLPDFLGDSSETLRLHFRGILRRAASPLHPREGLERQRIEGHPWLGESGLWFVPKYHEGNQNASAEEVECIAALSTVLCKPV
ncbi:MAG: hypothetical protein WCD63_15380, partial [Terrimicrobiaceae bacterium]